MVWFWILIGTNVDELCWGSFQDPLAVAVCSWALPIYFGGTSLVVGYLTLVSRYLKDVGCVVPLLTIVVLPGNLLVWMSAAIVAFVTSAPDLPTDLIGMAAFALIASQIFFFFEWGS